jgi:PAS domain S-box-containing protein
VAEGQRASWAADVFSTVVEHSPDCIATLDRSGKITWINPRGLEMLEAERLDQVVGLDWVKLWSGDDHRQAARSAIDLAWSGGVGRFEACGPTFGGQTKWWNVAVVPLPAAPGDGAALLSVSRDITERRAIEFKLIESEERIRSMADHTPVMTAITDEREAQRRSDQFLATLAHELRNPLASILTGLEVIRASSSDPAMVARVASMMERQTGQMVHLIDDLLDMARINTGKVALKKSVVPLDDIPRGVVEAARPLLKQDSGKWQRVLIVEDAKSTADILAMFFELEGREVDVACDGEEAVRKVALSLPELILMDLGMPRMDGFEAARKIRALPGGEGLILVALSGWGQPQDRVRSREAGFDEHLVKPVSPSDLRQLLQRLDAGRASS